MIVKALHLKKTRKCSFQHKASPWAQVILQARKGTVKAIKNFQVSASSLELTLQVKRAHSDRADIMTKIEQ